MKESFTWCLSRGERDASVTDMREAKYESLTVQGIADDAPRTACTVMHVDDKFLIQISQDHGVDQHLIFLSYRQARRLADYIKMTVPQENV